MKIDLSGNSDNEKRKIVDAFRQMYDKSKTPLMMGDTSYICEGHLVLDHSSTTKFTIKINKEDTERYTKNKIDEIISYNSYYKIECYDDKNELAVHIDKDKLINELFEYIKLVKVI